MSNMLACLEKQITTCRAMMALFQQERKLIQEEESAPLAQIQENLRSKQTLAGVLAEAIAGLRLLPPEEEPATRQELVREVTSLIEQLLVIEQENSRILRNRVQENRRVEQAAPAPPRLKRLTLQPDLPFLPPRADTPPPRRSTAPHPFARLNRHA